ncbi:MAG: calcium/sodium antiporter [Verrucomicrobia bacterium]|nr:calcium/sodium antiporter [Verrucomicrobiota bacterium]MCH8513723.1 calcium/sodium antiporter [Kiritimatiellia bacterium]
MLYPLLALVCGLVILIWSSDRFVAGASALARISGVPPLVIGIIVIGFGTSAPELVVSATSSWQGNPGLALGNAYGSNISNFGLILGLAALIKPIRVQSGILRRELPLLTLVTLISVAMLANLDISRVNGVILLLLFVGVMFWIVRQGLQQPDDEILRGVLDETPPAENSITWSVLILLLGLVFLVGSSRLVVWGAVGLAKLFGVGDLLIGLTVVAIGTSLPELASTLVASRKGEDDLALGNLVGSNLFNTLGVVGIAGVIHPLGIQTEMITRDLLVMTLLTVSLFAIGYGRHGHGRVNRFEGALLLCSYFGYLAWLVLPKI